MRLPKMSDEARGKLTQLEQSLEQLSAQKKQFHAQLVQSKAALEGIAKEDEAFKIIGNLMIKADVSSLRKELTDRQETLQVRMDSIEKQEEKLRTQVKDAQDEVMKKMK